MPNAVAHPPDIDGFGFGWDMVHNDPVSQSYLNAKPVHSQAIQFLMVNEIQDLGGEALAHSHSCSPLP